MTLGSLRNVFLRTLRDQRRALLGYGIGIGLLVLFTGAFYPTVRDQADQFRQLAEAMPKSMRAFVGDLGDLTSPAGYLRGRLLAVTLPVLFVVYAITKGSDVIGGEEERGTLDVLLAQPLTRTQAYLQKAAGVATGLTFLSVLVLGGLLAINAVFAMGIGTLNILAATLALLFLGLSHGALALGATGLGLRRGGASSVAATVAVGGYLLNAFANLSQALEPLRPLSPFSYYAEPDPIAQGLDPVALLVLGLLVVLAAGAGLLRFRRRDIAV